MQFYGDQVKHDYSLLYPVRVIEVIPPRRYDVDPRPRHQVRYRYKARGDPWLLAEYTMPDTWGPAFDIVAEYAYQAFAAAWHTSVIYFDEGAQQYVRVGWYELRLGWWWGREPTSPAKVPEDLDQRLRAYVPPKTESLRLLDYEIQLRQRVYGNVEKWPDLSQDAKWLASIERGDPVWAP